MNVQPDTSTQCFCHDSLDCPDEATTPIGLRELAHLGELLSVVDEFLRSGEDVACLLAECLAIRGGRPDPHGEASLLIDRVGFAAADLRHRLATTAGRRR